MQGVGNLLPYDFTATKEELDDELPLWAWAG